MAFNYCFEKKRKKDETLKKKVEEIMKITRVPIRGSVCVFKIKTPFINLNVVIFHSMNVNLAPPKLPQFLQGLGGLTSPVSEDGIQKVDSSHTSCTVHLASPSGFSIKLSLNQINFDNIDINNWKFILFLACLNSCCGPFGPK